jgi:hypothetical protein
MKDEWPEGFMLAAKLSFRWPQCARTDLKKIIHSSNNDGIDLITATLYWDPKRRPNAVQVFAESQCYSTSLFSFVISVFETSVF